MDESVLKAAYNEVKGIGIKDIRVVDFYFVYVVPAARKLKSECPSYTGVIDKLKEMGIRVFQEAFIWRIAIS